MSNPNTQQDTSITTALKLMQVIEKDELVFDRVYIESAIEKLANRLT